MSQNMMFSVIVALALIAAVLAQKNFLNETDAPGLKAGRLDVELGSCSYTDTCSSGGYEGVCVSVSAGCCDGGTVSFVHEASKLNSNNNLFINSIH